MREISSAELLEHFRRDSVRISGNDINLSLRPAFRRLLAKLGNPQDKIPPVLHVAGTNGKGSVCAFLRAITEAAGKRTHVYTSPHLVRFHERIRVAGDLIEEDELVELLQLAHGLTPDGGVTYFEAATAVALEAFARHQADVTILETGLGGRLDATNVLDKKAATVITRISYDHREYLGNTLTEIAREKAGIMRSGVPCFVMGQPDEEAREALRGAAAKIGAPLFMGGEDWHVEKTANGFCYRDVKHRLDLPMPSLLGGHQLVNAGLAVAVLLNTDLGLGLKEEDFCNGIKSATWPARLQHITKGRFAAMMPEGSELWLDGGHNDSAGEVLAAQAAAWQADGKNLHLVCGMLMTKHPREFLAPLVLYVSNLTTVTIADEPQSFTAGALAAEAKALGIEAKTAESLAVAVKEAAKDGGRVLICGSLYLAGQFLAENDVA